MSLLKIPRLVLTSALLSLGGCAVGPDFQAPQAQLPTQWRDAGAGGPASAPVAQPVNDAWWDSFGDPELSALVAEASAANPDILIAYERLRQSRAALRVSEADGLPKLGATASYRRGQNSEAGLSDPSGRGGKSSFNLWQTSVDASWELDLWGRVRREVEQAGALSQAALEAQRGVMLSVLAETASHYIRLRGAQNQLAVLRQTLDNANRNLALTRLRQREGVATELDVSQADAQAAAIEAAVPPLAVRVDQLMNALALLLDQPPHALHARLETLAPIPAVRCGCRWACPASWPSGVPTSARLRPACMPRWPRSAWPRAISIRASPCRATSACRRCNWASWTPTAPASSAWARRCRFPLRGRQAARPAAAARGAGPRGSAGIPENRARRLARCRQRHDGLS